MRITKPSVAIILYTSKKLKDGSHPVVLRVTYKGERKYFTLGVGSCHASSWDEPSARFIIRNEVTREEKEKLKRLNQELSANEGKAIQIVDEIKDSFSFNRFEQAFFVTSNLKKVLGYIDEEIMKLRKEDRAGYLSNTKTLRNLLYAFSGGKDFTFIDIDKRFLERFESYLLDDHTLTIKTRTGKEKKTVTRCSTNGVAVYMRQLKAIVNRAISDGLLKKEYYPFADYKIRKEVTAKRALTKVQIDSIIKFQVDEKSRLFHSKNFFVFSYLTRGMNMIDIARLKFDDIIDNRIVYIRSKTKRSQGSGRAFSILCVGMVRDMIAYYRTNYFPGYGYIFPILKKHHTTNIKQKEVIGKHTARTNKDIQEICRTLGIPAADKVTFYSARHSWATLSKKAGVRTELIQEGMGHGNVTTTEIYLAQFDNEELDKADQHLNEYSFQAFKKTS